MDVALSGVRVRLAAAVSRCGNVTCSRMRKIVADEGGGVQTQATRLDFPFESIR
jgi:hypothetical protein